MFDEGQSTGIRCQPRTRSGGRAQRPHRLAIRGVQALADVALNEIKQVDSIRYTYRIKGAAPKCEPISEAVQPENERCRLRCPITAIGSPRLSTTTRSSQPERACH